MIALSLPPPPACSVGGASAGTAGPAAGPRRCARFAAQQLDVDAETIHAYARRQQTVSEHQQRIGQYLRLRTFDPATEEQLARFLEDEALRLDRTGSLLARARFWLRDEHVLAPADSVLRRPVGAARQKARAMLTERMAERLSAPIRARLDAPESGGGEKAVPGRADLKYSWALAMARNLPASQPAKRQAVPAR